MLFNEMVMLLDMMMKGQYLLRGQDLLVVAGDGLIAGVGVVLWGDGFCLEPGIHLGLKTFPIFLFPAVHDRVVAIQPLLIQLNKDLSFVSLRNI